MQWSKPTLIALNMNAEIGAYQNDFDGDPRPITGPQAVNAATDSAESARSRPSAPRSADA